MYICLVTILPPALNRTIPLFSKSFIALAKRHRYITVFWAVSGAELGPALELEFGPVELFFETRGAGSIPSPGPGPCPSSVFFFFVPVAGGGATLFAVLMNKF